MSHTTNERIIEIPWALMQLPQSGLILDVGSCDATYLQVIHQPGRNLHCLDPRDCRGEIPHGAVFYNQNLIGNDLPGKTYDAVLLISTLEHIGLPCYGHTPFPDGDRMALAEAWRLLKPEGVLIVTVPVGQAKMATWYRQYSPAGLQRLFAGWRTTISYWGFDGHHYHPIPAEEVERYDYRDSPHIGVGAGAIAGIVAYPQ
ncbi:MAG TPA: methyltransferase domain-containing protein [Roseiflexaceae bacterium]|nr:methyltransferase domain-containing protein [Roseiflexaceae bacterium]